MKNIFALAALMLVASGSAATAFRVEAQSAAPSNPFAPTTAQQSFPTRVQFQPAQPRPGQKLTITYDPKAGPLQSAKSVSLIYGFTAWETHLEARRQAPLQAKAGQWQAVIDVPSDATYFWCFIRGEKETEEDTNNGAWWETYLFSASGAPVLNARVERAMMYGFGKLNPRDKDAQELQLLEEELRVFPTNAGAWAVIWGLRYQMANQSLQTKETITGEIRQLFEAHRKEVWAYEAAALGFNQIGHNPDGVAVIREFIARFPEDSSLDGRIEFFLGNWGTLAEWEALPTRAPRWKDKPSYWERLMHFYTRYKVEPPRLQRAGEELLARTPKEKDSHGDTRFDVAEQWLERGVDPKAAERVAREAVAISEIGSRPFLSESREKEKFNNRKVIIHIHRSALGWALYQQQRYAEALRELEKAVEIKEREQISSAAVYYRLGQTLEKLNHPQEALEAYFKELAWGSHYEPPSRAALTALYYRQHGNLEGLEITIKSRVNELLLKVQTEFVEEIDEELGRFDLLDAQGKPLNLSQYRGKVVIIDFWATWCSPCLKSLAHTQTVQQAFPEQIVVIAPTADPEESRADAAAYLKKKSYDFVLAIDDEKRRSMQFLTIPVRLVLDQKGRLRIREYGGLPENEPAFEKKLRALLSR